MTLMSDVAHERNVYLMVAINANTLLCIEYVNCID
jgi:hypothetical protein